MPEERASKAGLDGRVPVADYLKKYDPYVRTLFREVLKVARSVAGKLEQRAYPGWGLHVISDRGEIVLSGFPAHVNVRFRISDRLRDPSGLLRGSGPTTRHVKVASLADAASPSLRDLIRSELAGGPRRLTLKEGKGRQILDRVREISVALPNVSERLSHGTPSFFTRGKQFVQVWAGHHADHGLQMWCAAPLGVQSELVKADPDRFFVPPYVGHRGWLGIRLEKPDWPEIERVIQDAHALVAGGGRTRY